MAKRLKAQKGMCRNEFVTALAGRLGVEKKDAEKITASFLGVLETAWREGRTVCFPNFGVFELRATAERMGRNPKTMEEHLIPASYKPVFCPTKGLREAIRQAMENETVPDSAANF